MHLRVDCVVNCNVTEARDCPDHLIDIVTLVLILCTAFTINRNLGTCHGRCLQAFDLQSLRDLPDMEQLHDAGLSE